MEKKLSERIKLLRGKDSFRIFGTRCGISEGSVRNMEAGKDVSVGTLRKVAMACGKTISWLVGEAENQVYGEVDEGRIAATIEPGNQEKKRLLIANSTRPTVTQDSLRTIVEWMDDYYGKHPGQSLWFYDDIRERYCSFKEFCEKKQKSGNHLDIPQKQVSVNGEK